jgi:protein TonB
MTVKKNAKFDLEKRRKAFFQIGLLFAVSIVLVAFEWDSFTVKNLVHNERTDIPEELVMEEVEDEKNDVIEIIEPPKPVMERVVEPIFDPLRAKVSDVNLDPQVGTPMINVNLKPTSNIGGNGSGLGTTTGGHKVFHNVVGVMPVFSEGSLLSYIKKHVVYSQNAIDLGAEGKVYVEFAVMKTGEVKNVRIVKSDDELLNESAIEVIKNLPRFQPGMQRGRRVNVIMTVPINYKLG